MPLKCLLTTLIFVVLSFAAGCSTAETEGFAISGVVKNAPAQSIVLTREDDLHRKKNTAVAAIPVDAGGKFSMNFDLEPAIYTLDFFGKKQITLAIDTGQKITIEADLNDIPSVNVVGSADTLKLEEYEKFRKESLARLLTSVRDDIKKIGEGDTADKKAELARLGDLEITNYDKHRDELIDFVQNKMDGSIAVYATSIRWDGGRNLSKLELIANAFAAKHPGLAVTDKVREKVDLIRNTSVGGTVKNINLPDRTGNLSDLSSVNTKYTLIDFWASWCPPCRREAPDLVDLYDRYKAIGFEIFSVSLDSERDLWLKALETDKRTWPNVSDLREYETEAAFNYSVTALPANFLIDSNRKIIARNLRVAEIDAKLKELFAK